MRSSVVLPHPEGPSKVPSSPGFNARVTPANAVTDPYRFSMFSILSIALAQGNRRFFQFAMLSARQRLHSPVGHPHHYHQANHKNRAIGGGHPQPPVLNAIQNDLGGEVILGAHQKDNRRDGGDRPDETGGERRDDRPLRQRQ